MKGFEQAFSGKENAKKEDKGKSHEKEVGLQDLVGIARYVEGAARDFQKGADFFIELERKKKADTATLLDVGNAFFKAGSIAWPHIKLATDKCKKILDELEAEMEKADDERK